MRMHKLFELPDEILDEILKFLTNGYEQRLIFKYRNICRHFFMLGYEEQCYCLNLSLRPNTEKFISYDSVKNFTLRKNRGPYPWLENIKLPINAKKVELCPDTINLIESFPKGLKTLIVKNRIPFESDRLTDLPKDMTSLSIFAPYFVGTVFDKLPKNLEELHLTSVSRNSKEKLENLPKSLKTLNLSGFKFLDQTKLPVGLVELDLTFHGKIEQIFDFRLLKSLKRLSFNGAMFNQSLENCLPDSLTILIINSDSFNQRVSGILPPRLEILNLFCKLFNHSVADLSPTLKRLQIVSEVFIYEINLLPPKLKSLYIKSFFFDNSLSYLPQGLISLEMHCQQLNQSVDDLPPRLEHLDISHSNEFRQSLLNLPLTLKTLIIASPAFTLAMCSRSLFLTLTYISINGNELSIV